MYQPLNLISHDGESEDFRFERQDYRRRDGDALLGPSPFSWNERQRSDLLSLFNARDAEGARQRIADDLSEFLTGLGYRADANALDAADARGEEIIFTISSEAPELYTLPWEITSTGPSGTYLADHPAVIVRHAWPGLPARAPASTPAHPGVLLAWSEAGGRVPHRRMGAILSAACEAGGVAYKELPHFDTDTLQDALDSSPMSVLHILCHGMASPRPGEPPRLAWGDPGRAPVAATQISRLLRPYREQIRLVVLSCCGSGDSAADALYLGSIAQEIHRKGISTVLCSRSLLSIPGALALAGELYPRLLRDGWSLERALRSARMKLFREDEAGETHESDAYAIEMYTTALERWSPGAGPEQERPVLSTYPFGTPEAPSPRAAPPRQTLTLLPAETPEARKAQREALLAALRALGEDPASALYDSPDKVPGVVPAPTHTMVGAMAGDIREPRPDEPPALTDAQKGAERERTQALEAATRAASAAADALRAAAEGTVEAAALASKACAVAEQTRRHYEENRLREAALKSEQRTDHSTDPAQFKAKGPLVLWVSVDGAQRLMQAMKDGRLEQKLGFGVAALQVHTPFFPTPAALGPGGLGGFSPPPAAPPAPPPPPPVAGAIGAKLAAGLGGLGAVGVAVVAALNLSPKAPAPVAPSTPTVEAAAAPVDADGDGSFADVDCADDDAAVHPGATELVGNGKDDDCDPTSTDLAAPLSAEQPKCVVDSSGMVVADNLTVGRTGAPSATPACITDADGDLYTPDGFVGKSRSNGTFLWYKAKEGAFDCDDQNKAVNPLVAEIPLNKKDDDCDGTVDNSAVAAPGSKTGAAAAKAQTAGAALKGIRKK